VKQLRFEENGKYHSPPILLQPKKRKTDSGKFSTADRLSDLAVPHLSRDPPERGDAYIAHRTALILYIPV